MADGGGQVVVVVVVAMIQCRTHTTDASGRPGTFHHPVGAAVGAADTSAVGAVVGAKLERTNTEPPLHGRVKLQSHASAQCSV
jgi:hypothetical protein